MTQNLKAKNVILEKFSETQNVKNVRTIPMSIKNLTDVWHVLMDLNVKKARKYHADPVVFTKKENASIVLLVFIVLVVQKHQENVQQADTQSLVPLDVRQIKKELMSKKKPISEKRDSPIWIAHRDNFRTGMDVQIVLLVPMVRMALDVSHVLLDMRPPLDSLAALHALIIRLFLEILVQIAQLDRYQMVQNQNVFHVLLGILVLHQTTFCYVLTVIFD